MKAGLGILLCSVCLGAQGTAAGAAVQAAGIEATDRAEIQEFTISAEVLPSDKPTYDVRLTIENQGADWEGTVRLMLEETYYGEPNNCAYDTVISLPQGSMKQFLVKIPKESVEHTDGIVAISLVDKDNKKIAKKEFPKLLQNGADFLSMGILSDEYPSLTYLDMGGNEIYYYNGNYPVKLVELDQDNLEASLDALDFLVVDSYNTSVLAETVLKDIEQWLDDGGVLLIGTGSSAEEVLSGFDYLDVECLRICEPGEGTSLIETYGGYGYIEQFHLAELADKNDEFDRAYGNLILMTSWGDGSVGILPYALTELGKADITAQDSATQEEIADTAAQDSVTQEGIVEEILSNVSGYANARYKQGQFDIDDWYNSRFLSFLGNGSNNLRFGGLKLIVVLYVIFVGPVLYLLLRFMKKQDFYWLAVPAAALVGIFLVYFAGRGFKVVSTNVYSVTLENLSGNEDAKTYLHCYDANHKEWALQLADRYDYIGPLMGDYRDNNTGEKYYQHIKKEGDRFFFGIRPDTSFEDSYFVAGTAYKTENRRILSNIKVLGVGGISGTVVNDTGKDFPYFAVIAKDNLFVYKNLPAGATVDLDSMKIVYESVNNSYYVYDYIREIQRREEGENLDTLAALAIGFSPAYYQLANNPDAIVVLGVTKDWDKAVDDNCSEVSYGCLYAIQ